MPILLDDSPETIAAAQIDMSMHTTGKTAPAPETPPRDGGFLTGLHCALVSVNPAGVITAFNHAAENLTRLKSDHVLSGPWTALPAPLKSLLEKTLADGHAVNDRSLTLFPGTPDETVIQATTSLCHDEKKKVVAVLLVFHDLTFATKIESNLRHLDRLASLGTLAAGAAHEVKNAMVAIKTFAELLLERQHDEEMTSLVIREIHRIDAIVSRLLRMAGPAKLTFAPVGLHAVLDNSLRLIQHRLGALDIQLIRSLDATHDRIKADEQQLSQAFINLLLNAIEATPGQGSLLVTTAVIPADKHTVQHQHAALPPQIHLTFQDTGGGISPENLARLFNPFFTTKPEGTGLGLAITRRIIQEHGGSITVESEVQKGTTFHIFLPLLDAGN